MAWARVDDSAYTHPKFLSLEPAAIGLWAMGLSYCAHHLTDGFIPRAQLPRLIAGPRAPKLAALLVKVGLWEDAGADGYQVHDYGDWNDAAEEIRRKRQQVRERQERYREAKTGRFGNASRNPSLHASSNALRDGLVTSTHATPLTTTPLPPSSTRTRDAVTERPGGTLRVPVEAAAWVHPDGCPKTEHLERFPADRRRQCAEHRDVVASDRGRLERSRA